MISETDLEQAWTEALLHDRYYQEQAEYFGEAELPARLVRATPEVRVRLLAEDAYLDTLWGLEDRGVPRRIALALHAEAALPPDSRRYSATPAMVGARAFIEEGLGIRRTHNALLLLGGVGAGKTAAAAWVLAQQREWNLVDPITQRHFYFGNVGGIRLSWVRMIRASEAARLSKFGDDRDEWRELLDVPVLAIDDFGTETLNTFWRERFAELVDVRYGSSESLTILTSNLGAAAFRKRYGARVASRLRDAALVVACGGRDLRASQHEAAGGGAL